MIGLGLGLTALRQSAAALNFDFATLGGSDAFLALDFDTGAYAVPADLGGGSYSTTAYETTTDLSQALTVSGGGAFIGIVDGVPVEYGAGQFVFDTLDGKKVLRGDAGVTRANGLNPQNYTDAGSTKTNLTAFGVFTPARITAGGNFSGAISSTTGADFTPTSQTICVTAVSREVDGAALSFYFTFGSGSSLLVQGNIGSITQTSATDMSLTSVSEELIGDGWYKIEMLIVSTISEAGQMSTRVAGGLSGSRAGLSVDCAACQVTLTDHFPGWVGGDQATSISRPAITYAWTTRVVTAVQSLGTTGDFAAAFRFSAAFDYDRQIHLNNFGSSLLANIRSNNSGIIFGSYGSNRFGEAILQGVGNAIMARSDSVGNTRLLHNTTFTSGGTYNSIDLSTISTAASFTLASHAGGFNWAGGMSRIVIAEVYPTQAQMEAWRDLP